MAEVYTMLAGYIDEENNTHKDFTVREIDGEVEELISNPEIKSNGSKVVRVILENCVESIGTFERKSMSKSKWKDIIQSLLVGDQDYMLLQIRKESIGDEMQMNHKCPSCGVDLTTIISTDELEVLPFLGSRELPFELPKGYTDKDGVVHKTGKLRFPNGLDREILDQVARKNLGQANTLLLTRCITEFEGLKVHDDILRKMGIKDREYLTRVLMENKFGIDLTIEVTCSSCGETFRGSLNMENFL